MHAAGKSLLIRNALARYAPEIQAALLEAEVENGREDAFVPGYRLPVLDAELESYFASSSIGISELGDYNGRRLRLLDLMGNARTRTTKTYPSLVMVARAVHYIRETGNSVVIVTPSSANKATALRDAVLGAYEIGIADPAHLSITVVVPEGSRDKLWASRLSTDPGLRERNPVVSYAGEPADGVKPLAYNFVSEYAEEFRSRYNVRLWYTLDITNYKVADVVRAYIERDFLPANPYRLHVHAVSSAFGLLGHNLGVTRITSAAGTTPACRYFLVQHLGTPDMVQSLYRGSVGLEYRPEYKLDESTGLYRQFADPRFPQETFDPYEYLDSTFYTHAPVTSAEMNAIIHSRGGGGIVVSLHECLERYAFIRQTLGPAGVVLPADPRELREWSLVMAVTGILNAIDRDLILEDDILIHGSGSYSRTDYEPISRKDLSPVADGDGLARRVAQAVQAGGGAGCDYQ